MAYEILWKPATADHLRTIDRRHRGLIRDTVRRRLSDEPGVATRNRKPLQKPAPIGQDLWELRLGPDNRFRVFYRTYPATRTVEVLAVGVKVRSKLTIGGEEVQP